MPILQVELLKGRTVEQKREMVKKVTDAITETLDCPKEAVSIIIREMELENFAKAGVLKADSK
ncbi:4-oxalocrotonate tautomerase [Candidatus Atribacteria bacterium RBG_19FT_COMBO_35_14]|uniref:Tautomerase n=1 Tax=Candidatus Sediminicultor quintus TaxID=1797291 RepID=A0A1F5AAN7_9BACT|nr:MAG: 4-oxalocrotonate tautomerase [Candidatus Atribacteria bacterium RBG_19FT_COMBO_35_14]